MIPAMFIQPLRKTSRCASVITARLLRINFILDKPGEGELLFDQKLSICFHDFEVHPC